MFASPALDTAIGLILVYLLLSLMCSAANEIIESWLRDRSADLERGIRQLLADDGGTGLARRLYEHPLVFSLFEGAYDPANTRNLPSYIPSSNFALALMDIVLPPTPDDGSGAAGALATGRPTSVASLRAAVAKMQDNDQVKHALLTLIDAAGDNAVTVRANIEGWFNSAMDRVSGWYKRRKQKIILVIGLLVSVLVNVSTITVAKTLWTNQAMRESITAVAEDYINAENQRAQANQATGAAEDPKARLSRSLNELQGFGLPIGWGIPLDWPARNGGAGTIARFAARLLFESLGGWLLTACAISLGAPFWFDLLNKFTVVRSTVKPAEKSPEQPSKA